MARSRLQTRCDNDTIEQVEAYADEKDISQSEAVRRLIRTGLVQKGHRSPQAAGYVQANINRRARLIGGALIAILLLVLLVVQFV